MTDTDQNAAAEAPEAQKTDLEQPVQETEQKAEGQDAAQEAEPQQEQAGEQAQADDSAQEQAAPAIPNDLELDAMSDEDIATLVADNTGTASDRETNIEFLRSIRPAPLPDHEPPAGDDAVEGPSLEERVATLEENYRRLELKLRHFV
jgi:hypothetical protein